MQSVVELHPRNEQDMIGALVFVFRVREEVQDEHRGAIPSHRQSQRRGIKIKQYFFTGHQGGILFVIRFVMPEYFQTHENLLYNIIP